MEWGRNTVKDYEIFEASCMTVVVISMVSR